MFIIKDGRRLFSSKKRNRLLITRKIFVKITEEEPLSVTDINVNTAFKVAWASFIRMGELTYTVVEAKKATFAEVTYKIGYFVCKKGLIRHFAPETKHD